MDPLYQENAKLQALADKLSKALFHNDSLIVYNSEHA